VVVVSGGVVRGVLELPVPGEAFVQCLRAATRRVAYLWVVSDGGWAVRVRVTLGVGAVDEAVTVVINPVIADLFDLAAQRAVVVCGAGEVVLSELEGRASLLAIRRLLRIAPFP
jgi:hypothetical protein